MLLYRRRLGNLLTLSDVPRGSLFEHFRAKCIFRYRSEAPPFSETEHQGFPILALIFMTHEATFEGFLPTKTEFVKITEHYVHAIAQSCVFRFSLACDSLDIPCDVFVSDSPIAACKCRASADGRYVIEISIGVYLAAIEISLMALHAEGFMDLQEFGFPSLFRPREPHPSEKHFFDYSWAFEPIVGSERCRLGELFPNLPLDFDHIEALEIVSNTVLSWIIGHEFSHLVLGHLPRLVENHIMPYGLLPGPTHDVDLLKAFEIEADLLTTQMVIKCAFPFGDVFAPLPENDRDNLGVRIRLLGSCCALSILLIDQFARHSGMHHAHPTSKVRLFNVAEAIVHSVYHLTRWPLASPDCGFAALWVASGVFADFDLIREKIYHGDPRSAFEAILLDTPQTYGVTAAAILLQYLEQIDLDAAVYPFNPFRAEAKGVGAILSSSGDGSIFLYRNSFQAETLERVRAFYRCDPQQLSPPWADALVTIREIAAIMGALDKLEIVEV